MNFSSSFQRKSESTKYAPLDSGFCPRGQPRNDHHRRNGSWSGRDLDQIAFRVLRYGFIKPVAGIARCGDQKAFSRQPGSQRINGCL